MILSGLVKNYPIQAILFNGNVSYKFYKKYIGTIPEVKEWELPSTSPANARANFDQLLEIWKSVFDSIF